MDILSKTKETKPQIGLGAIIGKPDGLKEIGCSSGSRDFLLPWL